MTVGSGSGRVGAENSLFRDETSGVVLYPVPARDVLIVEAKDAIESVRLTTLIGAKQPVTYSHQTDRKVTMQLGHTPDGMYLIIVRTSAGVVTKKIVVQQ